MFSALLGVALGGFANFPFPLAIFLVKMKENIYIAEWDNNMLIEQLQK